MCATNQTKHLKILNDVIEIFSKKKTLETLVNMDNEIGIYEYIERILK